MSKEAIRYIGCIGIKTSMRSLDQKTRSEVVKESINRLCKANDIPRRSESKSCGYVGNMLHNEPNLDHSGTEVQLCVSSTHLEVIAERYHLTIIQHEMPNVSFASKDEDVTYDFVAYVAKDEVYGRACFVLKCGLGTGGNVLDSIAHGFQERTKQILFNSNTISTKNPIDHHRCKSCLPNVYLQFTDKNRAEIRASLEREPWYHGSFLSREDSETHLKQDGDFLVRESTVDHFVLSVMHNGLKLHLLFDSLGPVKTKEMVFDDISEMIRYHHDGNKPIVADDRVVYLRNGVKPNPYC